MKNILNQLRKTCPTTGKYRGINWSNSWSVIAFPVTGLTALIWFLVRVIPKPSRVTYPCMKVAAPLASTSVGADILQANFPKTGTEEFGNYWYVNQTENNKLIFLR